MSDAAPLRNPTITAHMATISVFVDFFVWINPVLLNFLSNSIPILIWHRPTPLMCLSSLEEGNIYFDLIIRISSRCKLGADYCLQFPLLFPIDEQSANHGPLVEKEVTK
jgi:hypothetical protein